MLLTANLLKEEFNRMLNSIKLNPQDQTFVHK